MKQFLHPCEFLVPNKTTLQAYGETSDLGPCSCFYSSYKGDQPTEECNGEVEVDKVDSFLVEFPPVDISTKMKGRRHKANIGSAHVTQDTLVVYKN